jgi:hypothetical protein
MVIPPLTKLSLFCKKRPSWLRFGNDCNFIQNVFVKPNEQNRACSSYAMARKRRMKYKDEIQRYIHFLERKVYTGMQIMLPLLTFANLYNFLICAKNFHKNLLLSVIFYAKTSLYYKLSAFFDSL